MDNCFGEVFIMDVTDRMLVYRESARGLWNNYLREVGPYPDFDAISEFKVICAKLFDALVLRPHFHAVVPDGIFVKYDDDMAMLHRLPLPKDEDIQFIAVRILRKIRRLLEERGLLHDRYEMEPPNTMDMLAQLFANRLSPHGASCVVRLRSRPREKNDLVVPP